MKNLLLPLLVGVFCLTAQSVFAQDIEYQQPPKEIAEIIMSKPLPTAVLGNTNKQLVVLQRDCSLVPLAVLADSELRIGGIRINSKNFSETRSAFSNSLYLTDVATGKITQIAGMPQNPEIRDVKWSPSDKYFCFTNATEYEVELWRVDVTAAEPKAEKINKYKLNAIGGDAYTFLNDETILYRSVPTDLGEAPKNELPKGPIAQENLGKKRSMRTSQDLLGSPHDAKLFDHYCTSVFALFSPEGSKTIGDKAIIRSWVTSPNGEYMIVTTEHRPYSYLEGHRSFPSMTAIWSTNGEVVKVLKELPKQDGEKKEPKGEKKEATPAGFGWRADKPAMLTWTETERGDGDGEMRRPPMDEPKDKKEEKPEKRFTTKLYQCAAPFDFENKEIVAAPEYSLSGPITWGNDKIALYVESSIKQKFRRLVAFTPCDTTAKSVIVYTESTKVDTLGNFPVYGRPYIVKNQWGKNVLWLDAKNSYFYMSDNTRADANGDKTSFIDRFTFKGQKLENVWMGGAPYQDRIVSITDFKKLKFIIRRESNVDVPNYFVVDVKGKKATQFTFFENPIPILNGVKREFVTYKRADGLTMYANLYLPADYDKERDGKLPVLMWGYPREYKSFAAAEKARPNRYDFVRPANGSPILWVSQGYAIMEGISMAIVSEKTDSEPNDIFISQLIMNAEAAINFVDSIGVGDRERVAIGGHSYGAFMTANLLAHTKLFKAGIARSGAYNRSLTPFGFQSERRNYWKAKEVYDKMSPFNYADSLKTPILLIHGQMDNNAGTFPIQSERLYHALVGHGGTARYLQLPYESHSYSAVENVLHLLYETNAWLEKYVKNYVKKVAGKADAKAAETQER